MNKTVLGLDLGSNSLGWALLEEKDGRISRIIDLGCRIFTRAVEDKTPTPKNVERRNKRLGRRVLQRRARRKQRMLNYLISLKLLPVELRGHPQPEALLNKLGDPWELRVKALDRRLEPHEFGRVLLHFVQRRGFLSSKKQLAGDLVDDPDTIAYLDEIDENPSKDKEQDKEESAFKEDIAKVRVEIKKTGARTLGEYLYRLEKGKCKRNRSRAGGHLRTERKMYEEELDLIWETQRQYFSHLPDDFMDKDKGIKQIIFYQRPLKLKKDRVGKCSLEPKNNRAAMARLEVQRFRYLCDLNHLTYSDEEENNIRVVDKFKDSEKLVDLKDEFEGKKEVTSARIKKILGLGKKTKFNLEAKKLKGNITAYEIKTVLGERWNDFSGEQQKALVEDLLSIRKKSALKTRLLTHWKFDKEQAVKLCLLEFEPSHSNHSLKAINKLLPYLKEGLIYSKAREEAGYGYEKKKIEIQDALGPPPPTSNPIVNRGLHELKRVINAIIKQHGKPDVIRIEMARDLEMNTKRYRENEKRQNKNKTENEEATDEYRELGLGQYPSHDAKIKYRLWKEQNHLCAYSNRSIPKKAVFTPEVEIDHILPYKKSLDNSYMNKVLCYTEENRNKGDRTPRDAWEGDEKKWNQVTQAIENWKGLDSKVKRFYQTEADLQERDFIASQLNDTRYIARLSLGYVKELGCDVSVTKGYVVSEIRHQWGLNNLIGETDRKERTDHRHHTIDAACIAATSRSLYTKAVKQIKKDKLEIPEPYPNFRDELAENLKHLIVSHASQRKLSGSLHEDTGENYVEKHGGTVYRKNLDTGFGFTQAKKIIDDTIRELVLAHLEKYGNNPKKAFADGVTVYHKDKKTPIKRVRILRVQTTQEKLEKYKFGVKDGSGKVFKWMPYGNTHHVEIIKHKETGEYKGEFVTMMQASHRAKGIKSELNPDGTQQPMVRTEHGDEWQFIMALHVNDTVSIETGAGEREFYRVQKLETTCNRFVLRKNSAATLKNEDEERFISINKESFNKHDLRQHKINIIGIFDNDQKDY